VDVAIVICTHKRPALLAGAVQSLIEQNDSRATYEVIIVDNEITPNPDVQKTVKNAQERIAIHYVHERKIGLSYARNAGGMKSSSDYVCYIDDDAKAASGYLETLFDIIRVHRPEIFGGPYLPLFKVKKPDWFFDKYGAGSLGDKARYLNHQEYLYGGNIVFKRTILDELGWFDPNLGMAGKKSWYGEETKLIIEAWRRFPRLKIYYDPELLIFHLVPSQKMTIMNLLKTAFLKGKSQAYFWIPREQIRTAKLRAPLETIIDLFRLSYKFPRGIVFRNRQEYPYWQNFIAEEISPSLTTIGSNLRLTQDLLFSWIKESNDL
jgi:glycosyltransferase involved in cell wall biosynthesis